VILLISVSVFLATSLAVFAAFRWAGIRRGALENRLREAVSPAGAAPARSLPRFSGWVSKIRKAFGPPERESGEIASRVTRDVPSGVRLLLFQAGYRTDAAERACLWVRIAAPLLLPAAAVAGGKAVGMSDKALLLLATAFAAAGLFLPVMFLKSKARARREAIVDALPDALDLLTVCVEAGLGINSSFLRIAEEFRLGSPVLSEEFDIVNREMAAGKPRIDALRALADRAGVEDVKSLVAMLIQTERLGTSLAQSLRVHSDSLRLRRRQRAEEAAAKTTIKLVFPLVFLLFPALFLVILGPGVIQILKILFPAMNSGSGG